MQNKSIKTGKVWLDTDGKRIQAHGGSVFYKDGLYYWYGENKEKSTKGSGIWHWGVRCYTSKDLYNWEDKGLIIEPEPNDPSSPIHPTSLMDRPHILYNEKTKKYVCWLKIMDRNNGLDKQSMTVLVADNFMGPYQMIRKNYKPLGMDSGDFDLAVDEQTKKAYYFFEKVHTELICVQLSDDYTEVTDKSSSHFPHPRPPYTREAPVHFIRKGKHYIFTSGSTGYFPNESEVAVAEEWHGPYRILGNPHPRDRSKSSYSSQITDVLKIEGTDLYIAIADRWMPKFPRLRIATKMIADGMNRMYGRQEKGDTVKEAENKAEARGQEEKKVVNFNTAFSNYVWLPIRFEGDMPIIDWKKEWRIEDYL